MYGMIYHKLDRKNASNFLILDFFFPADFPNGFGISTTIRNFTSIRNFTLVLEFFTDGIFTRRNFTSIQISQMGLESK